jgi:hypothetical protein
MKQLRISRKRPDGQFRHEGKKSHRPDMFHVALTMKRRVVGIIVRYCRFLGVDERDVGQMLGGEEPTVAHGTQRKNRRMVGGKRPVDFKSNGVGGGRSRNSKENSNFLFRDVCLLGVCADAETRKHGSKV